jgi:hypothetical protein
MLFTRELAEFLIVLKLLMGSIIGLIVAALVYHSRFSLRMGIRSALLGAVGFLFASGLAGWADSNVYFYNGRRLDVTPEGENRWLQNRLAEHADLISVAGGSGAALLAGIRLEKKVRNS